MTDGPIVDVRDLTYTYPKTDGPAVASLEFQIPRGEIFGFLGPNGAGKSTTQKLLIGLLRDYQGSVSVFGRDLRQWGNDYYERLGVSFELPNHHLKLSALENLSYFRGLYARDTEDPRDLLDRVGLGTDADKRVSQFSKGMRGRLNVARALLPKPELLFLDEPTAGLDPLTSRQIRDLIRDRRQTGTTVFLTTHDMVLADDLCDRVAFIVGGGIALIDTPRALKLRHGTRTVRVELGADGRRDRREFPLDGLADNGDFLETLRQGTVQTMHTQETTLEEIFIQVTGTALR
jgi:fluoroquinolone transport system ATP-binding protein